jgi:hypothetical protein
MLTSPSHLVTRKRKYEAVLQFPVSLQNMSRDQFTLKEEEVKNI